MINPLETLDVKVPFVLLPVKLETRFGRDDSGFMLKVRIFPQLIMVNAHQPALQLSEIVAGERYWRDGWDNEAAEQAAWVALLDRIPAPRATYIVEQTTPLNISERINMPSPNFREHSELLGPYQPIHAACLPDYWIAFAYRDGKLITQAHSLPVQKVLALATDTITNLSGSSSSEAVRNILDNEQLGWLFSYEQAYAVGMAVTLGALSADDEIHGFDTLLVLGVSDEADPQVGQTALVNLLDAQRYTIGTAFVPQGTPTNNTAQKRSGYPPPDPLHVNSFRASHAGFNVGDNTDGAAFADTLGIPRTTFVHVPGADGKEQALAAAMNHALWPVTLGYFLEQMAAPGTRLEGEVPLLRPDDLARVRHHFIRFVHGRGTAPILRLGNLPFGVLPVTALRQWLPSPTNPYAGEIAISRLRDLLLDAVGDALDRVRPDSPMPDGDLVRILSMDASSREVYVRGAFGGLTARGLALSQDEASGLSVFMNAEDWNATVELRREILHNFLENELGLHGAAPRLAELLFDARRFPLRYPDGGESGLKYEGLVTTGGELSEHETLETQQGRNYIVALWNAVPISTTGHGDLMNWSLGEAPLLEILLRHALLLQYADTLYSLMSEAGLPIPTRKEPELLRISRAPLPYTAWEMFQNQAPDGSGRTASEQLWEERDTLMHEFTSALALLSSAPTAELHRLLTETLDTTSHRLDAWITSIAAAQLDKMRTANVEGCYLGAFGWLEHVHPNSSTTAERGGFVHAPSTTHAATAAVLVSTAQTHEVQVRLSSRRVRAGMQLIQSRRAGLTIGAALGEHVEQVLYERDLARFIVPLRTTYPLTPENPHVSDGAPMILNVVDGLALRTAWLGNTFDWSPNGLVDVDDNARSLLTNALDSAFGRGAGEQVDPVDAMTDLLLSEAIHQIVQHDDAAANAALNALTSATTIPPIPRVVQTPRGGIDVTHRTALLLSDDRSSEWSSELTPRAETEPLLDAWVGRLLGNPNSIFARLAIPTPTPEDPETSLLHDVSLADLNIRPLDVLFMSDGELNTRLIRAGLTTINRIDVNIIDVRLNDAPADLPVDNGYTISDIRLVLSHLRSALGGARGFRPTDLPLDEIELEQEVYEDSLVRANELLVAIDTLRLTLDTELQSVEALLDTVADDSDTHIDTVSLRATLEQVALYGVDGAYPESLIDVDGDSVILAGALVERARAAVGKLKKRIEDAEIIKQELVKAPPNHLRWDVPERLASIAFGGFTLIPRNSVSGYMNVPRPYIAEGMGTRRIEIERWIAQAARAHPSLERWRLVCQLVQLLNARPSVDVLQFPPRQPNSLPERWLALDFGPQGERILPEDGQISLVVYLDGTANTPISGLLLAEWAERISRDEEITSIAFPHDAPAAQAPQVIFVAVAPPSATNWTEELLGETLSDAFGLVKLRGIDPDILNSLTNFPLADLLPGVLLAANAPPNDPSGVISTDFANLRRNNSQS